MLINKSITHNDFEPLTANDTVAEVKTRMEEGELETLPVVDSTTQKLIGQIKYDILLKADDNAAISDLGLNEAVKIYQGQHVFEAARLMLQYELKSLPLVDEQGTYLGVITKQEILESLSRMLNLAQTGSVITIELDPVDFTLSEIVQLIETEGAKILGITVESSEDTPKSFEVSFKLNLEDVSHVTSALKRYDYNIVVESESTVFGKDLEHRADELIKYIDM